MGHVTLKGPNRLGAAELDEGALTAAVVAVFAREDGSSGQTAAEAVLPARRALWRLAEVYLPRQLAASLRARLAPSDQTGRGGVRELRRALADWLDPPPECTACRRPITEETRLVACPAKPQRAYVGRGRRPGPTVCAPRTGPRGLRGGAAVARDVARCGTLALFTPIQLDTACAAAARLLRHGTAAYDLVVDRDARTLLEVTSRRNSEGSTDTTGECVPERRGHTSIAFHVCHPSTTPAPVQAARRHFDRVLDWAVRANGPLILKCQLRQYSPNGSATRADLVQGAAMGCRRALLDYDPAVARFSTYAIHWMRQGGGEAFADRDLVAVPDWAAGLRRAVEDRDLLPAQLLRLIGTVAETRPLGQFAAPFALADTDHPRRKQNVVADPRPVRPSDVQDAARVAAAHKEDGGGVDSHCVMLARRAELHANAATELAAYADLHRAVVEPATRATKGVAAKPARTLAPALSVETLVAGIIRAAARPARAKTDTGDERARERVAAYVAARLGLRAGQKAVTGGALLTALRSGAAVVVGIGTGEHDDAGGDSSDGPGAGRQERLPEHLADESPDPEEQAAEEDEARREMAALLQALEALRATDPEAAEVVRRRHAMDGLGDPETLEEIAAAPLRSTGRSRCREGVRQAYERGKQALKAAAPALLAALPSSVIAPDTECHATIDRQAPPLLLPLGKPSGIMQVVEGLAAARDVAVDHEIAIASPDSEVSVVDVAQRHPMVVRHRFQFEHDWHYSTMPTPEEFGAWAAERDAMVAAF